VNADLRGVPRIAGIAISFAFLGIAYLAGSLSHSNTVFVAVVAVGIVMRLVLRVAR
jgi:UDP-N-acetylmuramyl pentapeptide phosphotransferase/UDP-N-acetylglucosamine-1-phosphate transferase